MLQANKKGSAGVVRSANATFASEDYDRCERSRTSPSETTPVFFVSILLTVSRMFIGQAAACASLSTGRYSSGPRLYLPVWACEVQRTSESACPWTRFFNNSSTCYSVKADDTATIRNSSWLRYHPPLRSKSSAVCDETGFISFESASSLPRGARVELIAEDSDPCHTELQQYHLVSAILLPSNAQVIMKVSMML